MSRMNVDTLLENVARLDDGHGPAQSIDEARADALVLGAMRRSGIVTAERCAGTGRRGRAAWLRRSVLLGAGVVVITSAAAALVGGVGRKSLAGWLGSALPAQHANASGHRSAAAEASPRAVARSVSMTPIVAELVIETAPPGARAAPSAQTQVAPAPRRIASARDARHSTTQAAPVEHASSSPVPEPALDLLARANQYRRERQFGRALRVYLDVVERYPDTRQAEAARVAAADLRLQHLSDPKGAAEQYRAAASGTGQLGEEAAFGLVEAHRAAGRYDMEKTELERFLVRFPASPLAATARGRLNELKRHGW
ncbi:MAG: hypothetical protein JW940_30495 [Polyangiaceae bacterium]|nr:hypothetical protein [Polyangiaceae bacterium]